MNRSNSMATAAYFIALFWAFFALSCSKVEINSDKLYTGRIVRGDCPSYGVVVVENATIGSEWSLSRTTYKNVIGITNIPDTIQINDRISFYVDLSSNPMDCQAVKPCQQIISFQRPKDSYCATNIKRVE